MKKQKNNEYTKINSVKCLKCNTILISWHRHDFVSCKCGNFIDGGFSYRRIGGGASKNSLAEWPIYIKKSDWT